VIEQSLNRTILEAIAKKHQHIGSVPAGYYYPELYASVIEKP